METLNLNLIPGQPSKICHVSENDVGRVIRLKLVDGFIPYTLTGSESLKLRIRKPGKPIFTEAVTNTSDDYVDIVTSENMTDTPGRVYCKLRIGTIGAAAFYLDVEKKP